MHMTLIVAVRDWEDVDELMEPYGSEFKTAPHWGDEVTEGEKESFCRYYKVEPEGFDKAYNEHGDDWNGRGWRKDRKGVWREWITWNQNAKWDWYEIGGRWPGRLKLKDGAQTEPNVSFSWGWSGEEKKKFLGEHSRSTDRAFKGDVANLEDLTSFSLLIDGEWIDVEDEQGEDNLKVYEYLKDLPDDVELVCIDYHM